MEELNEARPLTDTPDPDLEDVLVADDEFAPLESERSTLEPLYFRNSLSSNGGALTSDERELAYSIFDPNDEVFIDAIKDAFG